jgi:hypothetical protein
MVSSKFKDVDVQVLRSLPRNILLSSGFQLDVKNSKACIIFTDNI